MVLQKSSTLEAEAARWGIELSEDIREHDLYTQFVNLQKDCSCCGMNNYRTLDADGTVFCAFCAHADQACCRN